jgi:hypothetical protein
MSAYIPGQGYIPGRGLLGLISEYVTEAPSPVPAPQPSAPPPEEVIIAEPSNSRNLLLENERLKGEINSLKHEVKIIKSMCGLDRRLKITKIEEEDLHKYCQYEIKLPLALNKSLILINKSQYDLEPNLKYLREDCYKEMKEHNYHVIPSTIPFNEMSLAEKIAARKKAEQEATMREEYEAVREKAERASLTRVNLRTFEQNKLSKNKTLYFTLEEKKSQCTNYQIDMQFSVLPISKIIESHHLDFTGFNSYIHDIEKYFVMNITFPKLPDFMKIDNVNTIDIDIYKMKGIYVITYE